MRTGRRRAPSTCGEVAHTVTLPDYPSGFLPALAFVVAIAGIGKGAFGQGTAGLAVPLLAMFVAPAQAAGIMLPLLCLMDIFGVHAYKRSWSRADVTALLPGAFAGIAVGGLVFGALSPDAVRLVIGVISVVFALNAWFRFTERIARFLARTEGPPGRLAGAAWGAMSGFTSTLAHAGGPPYTIYMLARRADKTTFVATSAVFFLAVNYIKLVPYWLLGQLNVGNLTTALVFAPLVPLAVWFGVWLHRRIPQAAFMQVTYTLLLVTGLKLVYDAFTL